MNLSTLSQTQKQLQQLVKQLGGVNAGLYLINRLTDTFSLGLSFNKYYFVAQFLSGDPLLPPGKGQSLRVVELPSDHISSHPCPRPAAVIADRYQQGAVCLAAYKNEEFAGCLWYAKSRYREDEVRCQYDLGSEQAAWDFDVYVEPKYRLSPVFLKLWDEASAKLVSEGCHWSLSRISAFNPMSLSSHRRMGAKPIGWAVFVCAGKVQVTISSIKPFMHFSISEKSFPTFQLQSPQS
jgi:hypothetical protein